jgi:acetyltransferase-like isoleucine patch superfamily enzyme
MFKACVPKIGVNDEYVTVAQWYVAKNAKVRKGEVVCSIETSKASLDIEAEAEGHIDYVVKEGGTLKIGEVLFVINDSHDRIDEAPVKQKSPPAAPIGKGLTGKAKLLATKLNINTAQIRKEGRIKEKDLLDLVSCKGAGKVSTPVFALEHQILKKKGGLLSNSFLNMISKDPGFKRLSGEEKIRLYRKNGARIGENVRLGKNVLILANQVIIGEGAAIGEGTFIKAEYFSLGKMSVLGRAIDIITRYADFGDLLFSGNSILIGGGGAFGRRSLIKTGTGCLISSECIINTAEEVVMGDYVGLSPRVQIYTHSHWQNVLEGHKATFGPVYIGDNAYVTGNCLIAPNVKIGRDVMVLANSLVAEDIADYSIAAGVPAKIIERINSDLTREQRDRIMLDIYKEIKDLLEFKNYDPREVFYSYSCDLAKIKVRVVLGFDFKGKARLGQVIFDLSKYEIRGKQDPYSDEVRNILRKRGIRFKPLYWRYTADEGFYNQ